MHAITVDEVFFNIALVVVYDEKGGRQVVRGNKQDAEAIADLLNNLDK